MLSIVTFFRKDASYLRIYPSPMTWRIINTGSEILRPDSKLNNEPLSERRRTDRLSNSWYNFVSDGKGVNYSILLGQCAPLLGVCGGLDGTG